MVYYGILHAVRKVGMLTLMVLVLASLTSTLGSATTYGIENDQSRSTLNKLISSFMATVPQNAKPDIGKCGDRCYVIDGDERFILKEGKEYQNAERPCDVYICTTNGVIKETISCPSSDAIEPCPDGGRVVRQPEQCCATCESTAPPEDTFGPWGEWTPCSKTCGRGAKARRRNCLIAKDGTSVDCVGEKLQIQDCNAQPCSNKCVWKEWSEWQPCSVTCGSGTETRTRKPISAYYEGPSCEGPSSDTRLCYREECLESECPSTHSVCDGQCIPDKDHDCIDDASDNCPNIHNTEQLDNDRDNIGNECDNCENVINFEQYDNDNDGEGDDCDNDDDNDGIFDRFDNCHFIANYKQLDSEEQKYKVECDTTENGIKIDYDALEEKKGRIANIMQMLLELYSTY